MEKYYKQLNAKCKEIAKEVIVDNSILSDNMLLCHLKGKFLVLHTLSFPDKY